MSKSPYFLASVIIFAYLVLRRIIIIVCTSHKYTWLYQYLSTELDFSIRPYVCMYVTYHWHFLYISYTAPWNYLFISLELYIYILGTILSLVVHFLYISLDLLCISREVSVHLYSLIFTSHWKYLSISLELSVHIFETICASHLNYLVILLEISEYLIRTSCTYLFR